MITAPYMGLAVWNSVTDTWNHEQLADNFRKLDEHDHASGKGVQIPTGGIKDGAITRAKLAPDTLAIDDDSIDTRHLRDLSVTNAKLGFNSVTESKLADQSVGADQIIDSNIFNRHLAPSIKNATSLHSSGRAITRFTPNGTTQIGQLAQAPRANGESDAVKVSVPAGGGLLYIYAEGAMTINPAGSPNDDDYVDIRAYIELSCGSIQVAIPLFLGRADKLNKKVTGASWAASPTDWGPTASFRRYDADQYTAITNAYGSLTAQSNSGGPVVKYIPTSSTTPLTAIARLKLKVGQKWTVNANTGGVRPSPNPPNVVFGVQTLSMWAQSIRSND